MKKDNNNSNDNNGDFILTSVISNSLYNVGPYLRINSSLIDRKTHTRNNIV